MTPDYVFLVDSEAPSLAAAVLDVGGCGTARSLTAENKLLAFRMSKRINDFVKLATLDNIVKMVPGKQQIEANQKGDC